MLFRSIDQRVLTDVLPDISSLNKGNTAGRITGNIDLGSTGTPVAITKTNVLDYLVDLGTVLDEANCPEGDRFVVIPAKMAGMIKKSDLKDAALAGDSTSILRNGRLGMIDRFTIYMSHNLSVSSGKFSLIAGHKMGLTFASQIDRKSTRLNSSH